MKGLRVPAGIFLILIGLYLSTYTGVAFSGDEQVTLDAALSLYRRGTLELALFNDLRPAFPAPVSIDQPVIALDVEPLQAYLGAVTAALAAALPGVGMVQSLYLLNIGITALSAVMVYAWGRLLGYGKGIAVGVALLYGAGTFAWVHSRSFFREPLFTLLSLISLYCLWRWRISSDHSLRRWGWLILTLIAFSGAMLTKVSALMFIPALITAAVPRRLNRRTILIGVGIAAVGLIVLAGFAWGAPGVRFRYLGKILSELSLLPVSEALRAWLFSPGASLWAFSPILIIAPLGALRLIQACRWRELTLPLILSASLMGGYATFQGWYSGLGWGPRYLLPLIPFLCLWFLPILEWVVPKRYPRLLLGGLIGVSVAVQVVGLNAPPTLHGDILAAQEPPRYPWIEGVWQVEDTPFAVALSQSDTVPSPLMIKATGRSWLIVLYALVGLAGIACLSLPRFPWWLMAGAVLAVTLSPYVILRAAYHDPRYGADDPILWQVLNQLDSELRPGDALLLNDSTYRNFFLNYYKRREPIYRLPDAPAEIIDPLKPPQITSSNPEAQVHPYLWTMLARVARHSERWWFLTPYTPFTPDRIRPTEYYLARHYFPMREVIGAERARLLLYLPVEAPAMNMPARTAYFADFGALRLLGIDLPAGNEFKPGTSMPISILWGAYPVDSERLFSPFDYGVSVSLIGAEGRTVAQHAAIPVGTFGLISTWKPGERYRDNHALELPADLAPGSYRVWLSVYDWRDGSKMPIQGTDPQSTEAHLTRVIVLLPH